MTTITLSTLCEVMCALHLSSYVNAPVLDRGGVMIVAPPGALKTTVLTLLDRHFANCLSYSNLNTKTLMHLRSELSGRSIRSIVLPDLQAIYAGDPRTSQRLEQTIMQLVGEGHMGASWQDARHHKFEARCMVFGALPHTFYEAMAPEWEKSGFLRRFLWLFYSLENNEALTDSLVAWERVRLTGLSVVPQVPAEAEIAFTATQEEMRELLGMLKYQPPPHEIQLVMLGRTLSVLKWHYKRIGSTAKAIDTMREFAAVLGRQAARLQTNGGEKHGTEKISRPRGIAR